MLLWFLYEYWSCWQVSSLFFLVGEYHEAVNHLTKAVAVCNQPQQLLQLFHGTLPDHVFQLLIEKLNDMSPSQQFVSTVRKIILWMSSRDLWARNKKCDQSRENVHQRVSNALPMLYQRFKPFNGKAFMYVFRWEFTKYFFHGIWNPLTWLLTISFSWPKWSLKLLFSAVYFLCMVKNISMFCYIF